MTGKNYRVTSNNFERAIGMAKLTSACYYTYITNYTIHCVNLRKSDCMPYCAVSRFWIRLLLLVMLRADKLWPETLREYDEMDFRNIKRSWSTSVPLNSVTISFATSEGSQAGNSTGETVK
jgi:hypothetical protein